MKYELTKTKAKKKKIENPMRPPIDGTPIRRYTACRITDEGESGTLAFMPQLSIRLDVDDEPQFRKELLSVVPDEEISRDRDLEVYYIHNKHLDLIKNLCYDYFDRVVFEQRDGKEFVLKNTERK